MCFRKAPHDAVNVTRSARDVVLWVVGVNDGQALVVLVGEGCNLVL